MSDHATNSFHELAGAIVPLSLRVLRLFGAMLGPAYTGNDVNAWQSQVFTFTKWNGVSAISPKIVIHDKNREVSRVAYRDTIYEVDFYRLKK